MLDKARRAEMVPRLRNTNWDKRLMLEHGITRSTPFCLFMSDGLYRGEMPSAQAISPVPVERQSGSVP